jgi:hypothetical protein
MSPTENESSANDAEAVSERIAAASRVVFMRVFLVSTDPKIDVKPS